VSGVDAEPARPIESGESQHWLRGPGAIAAATGIMNLSTYAFTIVAARVLGPQTYGALASLMATLLVIGVLQLSLQATAARRISANPEQVVEIERTVLGVAVRASIAVGAILLVLTPVVNQVLRLDSLPTAALVAVAAVPITLFGGQAGVLQGERRWWPLAAVYVASGVPRLFIGTALILWRPDETSAMVGVVLGAIPPVVLGWWVLRRPRAAGTPTRKHGVAHVVRETLHNSHALFAFFALSGADVVVARNTLPEHVAGLYAGGLILTKAVLFLPQFVIVVAFPAMSTVLERRRALVRSLTLVAGLGLCATAGARVLQDLALVFVGGDEYHEIASRLWVFAVLGTVVSLAQLLVYSTLARQGKRSVYLIWAALLCLVGLGSLADDLDSLLTVVVATDATLCALLLAVTVHWMRQHDAPVVAPQAER
jgi:O-antigen/teichoic acid export membrane protein